MKPSDYCWIFDSKLLEEVQELNQILAIPSINYRFNLIHQCYIERFVIAYPFLVLERDFLGFVMRIEIWGAVEYICQKNSKNETN